MRITDMRSLPLLPVILMWTHMWGFVHGQSSATPSTSRPIAASSSAGNTTSSSTSRVAPTATLSFQPIPTLTACQTHTIQWTLAGNSVSQYNISIYALGNTGNSSTISSSAIPATSPSPASSASLASSAQASARAAFVDLGKRASIDMQIANTSAATTGYPFLVNLPFGKYYLHGRVSDPTGTSANSGLFWVTEGDDMACLQGGVTNTSVPVGSVSSTTSSSGTSASATAIAGNAGSGGKSGVSSGAIAGIVVGAIVALVAIGLALLFYRKKKRSTGPAISGPQMVSRSGPHFGDRFPGAAAIVTPRQPERAHRPSNTTSTQGHFALTSMGDSSESHERDEGPFVGSYGSEVNTPNYLAGFGQSPAESPTTPRRDPFATAPNTPGDGYTSAFAPGDVSDFGAAAAAGTTREDRRRSQPITSPVMTSDRTRSNSQPSQGESGNIVKGGSSGGIKRVPSARRKPVPSLGAELRGQLRNESSQNGMRETSAKQSGGQRTETLRQSYQLMPDLPKS